MTPAATIAADSSLPNTGRSLKKISPIIAAMMTLDSRTAETAPSGAMVLA